MQFFTAITLTLSAMASLAAAVNIPLLTHREAQEGAGGPTTIFKDRFCASGFASCGRAGTNGDAGNRCAMSCQNFMGGVALGFCKCHTGWYPDECITLGKWSGRTKC
ncbi:hypothetical protein EsH8_I_000009 [Colletotrichum jinshuiense]